uniref:ATP synthase F0 subunit 6 n=1 Tax=Marcia japonica TaxID=368935 RepID=UPI00223741FF|nr:ATP synthase F0 subunit 6 [Marcia japonica]UYR95101.1 ATP synthase subunit 6 [Marcia japonica]
MMSDLFSFFDYALGTSGVLGCVSPWHGGLLLSTFVCCSLVYFYQLNSVETMVLLISDVLVGGMPETSKIWSGTPHLMVSLFFLLLSICILGFLPYSFSLGAHVVISSSLSLPFWFMSFSVNFNPNLRLLLIKSIYEGNSFVVSFFVIGSEFISILIRPVTLAARLSLNVIVGNLVLKMVSLVVVMLLFPFSYQLTILSKPILLGVICGLVAFGLSMAEFCILCLQTSVFYGLVVTYLSEAAVKPE